VINGGVQGYGPVEQWFFYRDVASQFEPDVVLIVVSVANDAIEAFDSRAALAAGSVVQAQASRARSQVRQVVRASAVLQLVRQRADQLRARVSNGVAERPLATYLDDPPPSVVQGIQVATRAFGLIAEDAQRRGARVGFVLMPARFQTDDLDFERVSLVASGLGRALKRHAASERFFSALQPLGYPVLDLLPVLMANRAEGTHFARNTHLSARGHQVTADAMRRFLVVQRLVPAPLS